MHKFSSINDELATCFSSRSYLFKQKVAVPDEEEEVSSGAAAAQQRLIFYEKKFASSGKCETTHVTILCRLPLSTATMPHQKCHFTSTIILHFYAKLSSFRTNPCCHVFVKYWRLTKYIYALLIVIFFSGGDSWSNILALSEICSSFFLSW